MSKIFNILKKVSDIHQHNFAKFMYKYYDNILPSSFANFSSNCTGLIIMPQGNKH